MGSSGAVDAGYGMRRIEFIGLPGAGKTTIRNRLVSFLKSIDGKRYITVEEAFMKTAISKVNFFQRPFLKTLPLDVAEKLSCRMSSVSHVLLEAQNKFISRRGESLGGFLVSSEYKNLSLHDRDILLGAFLKIGAIYEMIDEEFPDNTAIFFCEGFLQKSLMFLSQTVVDTADRDAVKYYLENIPLPNDVVYLKMDVFTSYERMCSRAKGLTKRLEFVDKSAAIEFMERCEAHFRSVLLWLGENTNVNIIEVDNRNHPGVVVKELMDKFSVDK